MHDALLKFLEFAKSNVAETDNMSLAQNARYFFDAILWVKHLCRPHRNPHEYFEHLLRGKRQHYEQSIKYIKQEISELKLLHKSFDLMMQKMIIRRVLLRKPRITVAEIEQFIADFNRANNSRFSIYRTRAAGDFGGYAEHLETTSLLGFTENYEKVGSDIKQFETMLGRKIESGHNSKKFADSLGMSAEYEFVFRLTSQFLHATPVSMTTDMKDISSQERLIFLEYIRAKTHEAILESDYLIQGFKGTSSLVAGLGSHFSATRR